MYRSNYLIKRFIKNSLPTDGLNQPTNNHQSLFAFSLLNAPRKPTNPFLLSHNYSQQSQVENLSQSSTSTEYGFPQKSKTKKNLKKFHASDNNRYNSKATYSYNHSNEAITDELALLGTYKNQGQIDLLIDTFESFKSNSKKITVHHYGILLEGLGRSGKFQEMFNYIKEMKAHGIPMNTVTYTTVIHSLGKHKKIIEMKQMIEEMKISEIPLNQITYSTIIAAYGAAGMISEMEEMIEEMETNNLPFNSMTYNCILKSYGEKCCIPKINSTVQKMKEHGIRLNVFNYNTIITAYGKSGHLEEIDEIFKEMKLLGVQPDIFTFNSLLHAAGSKGNLQYLNKYYQEMQTYGIPLDQFSFNSLLKGYSVAKDWDNFVKIRTIMEQTNYFDFVSACILIQSYGIFGKEDLVRSTFNTNFQFAKDQSTTHVIELFLSLLEAYIFLQKFDAFYDIFQQMKPFSYPWITKAGRIFIFGLKSFNLVPTSLLHAWNQLASSMVGKSTYEPLSLVEAQKLEIFLLHFKENKISSCTFEQDK